MAEILNFFTLGSAFWALALLMVIFSICKLDALVNAEHYTVSSIFFSLKMRKKWHTAVSGVLFAASIAVIVLAVLRILGDIPSAPLSVLSLSFVFYFLIGMFILGVIIWAEMAILCCFLFFIINIKEWGQK